MRVERLVKVDSISLAPGDVYQEEIVVSKREAPVSSQYYINAYYKQEFIAQYKVIEGVYKGK